MIECNIRAKINVFLELEFHVFNNECDANNSLFRLKGMFNLNTSLCD